MEDVRKELPFSIPSRGLVSFCKRLPVKVLFLVPKGIWSTCREGCTRQVDPLGVSRLESIAFLNPVPDDKDPEPPPLPSLVLCPAVP